MKTALPISLALGLLSLIVAAFLAFLFYVDSGAQPTSQAIVKPEGIAKALASAEDFASVKVVCQSIALSHDANTEALHSLSLRLRGLFNTAAGFALCWGLICGAAFLYLHFVLRRIYHAGQTHGL